MNNNDYMSVHSNNPVWTTLNQANIYPSKYAAKKHLRTLDNVPEDIKIVQIESVGNA